MIEFSDIVGGGRCRPSPYQLVLPQVVSLFEDHSICTHGLRTTVAVTITTITTRFIPPRLQGLFSVQVRLARPVQGLGEARGASAVCIGPACPVTLSLRRCIGQASTSRLGAGRGCSLEGELEGVQGALEDGRLVG